ncbi:hypothetical protein HPB48_026708 [Haemaphysalis longicornis]|uniref:RING-type domain-containing protein n=1 Tax=Haemaphysalis longicornis TaxID=44386 RepID=A0A9J6HCI3_HAELO|nr:hypothetical protein HPB48_026708 [Haemaphysalis longicornis]
MAHARQEFALVGYSEDLEKRPLKFVDAIPVARICSACGNIPRWTYTLLCGHIFCEPCYQSCTTASECVCPLDGEACDTADVSSKEYPADNLLSRKMSFSSYMMVDRIRSKFQAGGFGKDRQPVIRQSVAKKAGRYVNFLSLQKVEKERRKSTSQKVQAPKVIVVPR